MPLKSLRSRSRDSAGDKSVTLRATVLNMDKCALAALICLSSASWSLASLSGQETGAKLNFEPVQGVLFCGSTCLELPPPLKISSPRDLEEKVTSKKRLWKCRLPWRASLHRCRFSPYLWRECGKAAPKSVLVLMTPSEAVASRAQDRTATITNHFLQSGHQTRDLGG